MFITLIYLEAILIGKRLDHYKKLQLLSKPLSTVFVYRNNEWIEISSTHLAIGDILLIRECDKNIDCDSIIISGNCVVNEALITGETVPKQKQDINQSNSNIIEECHSRKFFLYSGSEILDVKPSNKLPINIKTKPPVNGIIVIVLRTGYYSIEGNLLHSMVYVDKSFAHYTNEDLYTYIFILIVISVVSIIFVGIYYLLYPQLLKSPLRLFIHMVMILTSTVPPELPMELTLSVTEAMEELKNYCIIIYI